MDFAGMNYLAVLAAAVAGFFVGWPWYRTFGRAWSRALGRDPDAPAKHTYQQYVVLAAAMLLMAWVLAGLIGHLGAGQVTFWNGIVSGVFVWIGFVATTMAVNHAFQGQTRALTLIDGGHWLAVLIVMGAIIGAFGV